MFKIRVTGDWCDRSKNKHYVMVDGESVTILNDKLRIWKTRGGAERFKDRLTKRWSKKFTLTVE